MGGLAGALGGRTGGSGRQETAPNSETVQFRRFKGVNQTDARQALDDDEFFWLENAQPVGNGNVHITHASAASITTFGVAVATLWGFVLAGNPRLFTIHTDGSMRQITTGGTVTVVTAAGNLTTAARMTLWKDTDVLIIDPTKGYFKWDGTTFTTIDATKTGVDVAVFEGRAWLVTGRRTITFTAPATNNDFNPANGAGSDTITDAAFVGSIVRLLSAVEQLWIVGQGAVNAISNVQTSGGVTTFSNTNIVTNVGTIFASSVTSFFRTFLFLAPYGVYAIVGATPQKLSDKLDTLFNDLVFSTDQPAAVFTSHDVFIWTTLVTYADPVLGNRPMLLCFAQGKWFFASPNMATSGLTWITSLVVNGVPQLWGTGGTDLFQLMADDTTEVTYKIQSKLWDFGLSTQRKVFTRVGFELQSNDVVTPSLTIENENTSLNVTLTFATNEIVWLGSGVIIFQGSGDIHWSTAGLVLARRTVDMIGDYLGMTISGTDLHWTLSAMIVQLRRGGDWN